MPLLSLIFLLNPIAGIASWIWVALRNIDRTSWTALRGLALLLSLYLGFVNTTKELYGDFWHTMNTTVMHSTVLCYSTCSCMPRNPFTIHSLGLSVDSPMPIGLSM